ncbi:MAG: hypothetical protein R3B51_11695 [Thermodesulfobacteriota bacterium]
MGRGSAFERRGRFLRRLPLEERISLDGMDFELAHRPDPETLPILERGKETTDPVSCRKFILVGHSHKPYIRSFGDTAVLNPAPSVSLG